METQNLFERWTFKDLCKFFKVESLKNRNLFKFL
jgi:hypothetical protein